MAIEKISHNGIEWTNITQPDQEAVEFLSRKYEFHPLTLEDVLSRFQHPKIDAYPEYLFVILQFPVYDETKKLYKRVEVDVYVGKNYLITISSDRLQPLHGLFADCQRHPETAKRYMGRGIALLLYEIIDHLFDTVFPLINEKYDVIFRLEEEIFELPEMKDVIQEIMILKRDIINLWRIITPQRTVLSDLEIKYKKFIPEELDVYFDDIVDKIDKMTNQLKTAEAYAAVLEDANETLLTRNTNRVIKILTVFSVIMLPLTFVTSYYGMNLGLPLQDNPNGIVYINILLFILLVGMFGFFIKKKWL